MINLKYKQQVSLLLEVIEPILNDKKLALKGGTAINLFNLNMPRLSVDLDLIYLPVNPRDEFVNDINTVFNQMSSRIKSYQVDIHRTKEGIPKQIRVKNTEAEVKAEINLILRGVVYPPKEKQLCLKAQDVFERNVSVLCASF